MKGLLTKSPDGTLSATLTDAWGYVSVLTGTKTEGGYDIEITLRKIPAEFALPGDEDDFEVVK